MLKIGLFRNLTNSERSLSISMSVVAILGIRLFQKELMLTCNMEMKSSASSAMILSNTYRKYHDDAAEQSRFTRRRDRVLSRIGRQWPGASERAALAAYGDH